MKYLLAFIFICGSAFGDTIVVNENYPNAQDHQEGFDIDILRAVYKINNEEFNSISSENLSSLFKDVSGGMIGAGGISVTADREKDFDFALYMNSGLKVIYKKENNDKNLLFRLIEFRYFKGLWATLKREEVLHMAFALLVATVLFSHLIWFAERGSPKIEDRYAKGICQAMYFCVVTKSTVGYGDFTVAKVVSRIWVILMIFFGISMFGNYTGLTTANIIDENEARTINSLQDLAGKNIAVKMGSYSNVVALEAGLTPTEYPSIDQVKRAVLEGDCEFAIVDAPQANHSSKNIPTLGVVPRVFKEHQYGFAFPNGDSRVEKFNIAILKLKETGEYNKIYKRWF